MQLISRYIKVLLRSFCFILHFKFIVPGYPQEHPGRRESQLLTQEQHSVFAEVSVSNASLNTAGHLGFPSRLRV